MSIPEYPINPTEQYLAAMLGEDVELPEYPITREHQYLAALVGQISGLKTDVNQLDEIVMGSLFDGTDVTYRRVMRAYFNAHGVNAMTPAGLTDLLAQWYADTRDQWNGWTTFYQKDVSNVSTGTRGGDNTGMSCTPSTDATAGQDDFAGLPLFAPTDVNYEIDETTLEPVITGIKGITDSFERDNPDKLVGVAQMSGWHWRDSLAETFVEGYSSQPQEGHDYCAPVPEAVRIDGTMREFVVHTKYMGHMVGDKMRAYAGVIPTAWQSHNTLQTNAKKNGSQYGGGSVLLQSWLILMTRIKYASLTLDGIIQGCLSYNYQYYAEKAETGVRRVLVSTANGANLLVGSGVLIGNLGSNVSTDRGAAANYSVTGPKGAIITAKENVTIDGTTYTAIYVDTENAFDTTGDGTKTEGNTIISTFHWPSGTNDAVLGNDGSIVNCTNAKYPAKLQGIEYSVGCYEVFGDVILSVNPPDTDNEYGYYSAALVNRAANQANSVTENYADSGIICPKPASAAAWNYISVEGFANGFYMPEDVTDGSSSKYTKDAFYQLAQVTAVTLREWLAFAYLVSGSARGGLGCVFGDNALAYAAWSIGGRPSACANRGVWGE